MAVGGDTGRRVGQACAPRLVVVPRFAAGVPTRLTPLSDTEAFLSLALHAVNLLPHGVAGSAALGRVVAQSACYALTMSDLDEACALVSGLVEGVTAGGGRPVGECGPCRLTRRVWRGPTRRAGASTVELDDNVAVYDDVGQLLILLNTSAAAVWEHCDGATTVDDMVRGLGGRAPGRRRRHRRGRAPDGAQAGGAGPGGRRSDRPERVAAPAGVGEDGACPSSISRTTPAPTRWPRRSGVTAPPSSTGWLPRNCCSG